VYQIDKDIEDEKVTLITVDPKTIKIPLNRI
jgi:hypothetical protein